MGQPCEFQAYLERPQAENPLTIYERWRKCNG
jgi:hypothetical protein